MHLKKPALILLLLASGLIMGASLFKCRTVHSYEEMADIRPGWPIAAVSELAHQLRKRRAHER